MNNPFLDWKDEEQCRGNYARDKEGFETPIHGGNAVSWCALGRVMLKIGRQGVVEEFTTWMVQTTKVTVANQNDILKRKPVWFRDKWDEFIIDKHPELIPVSMPEPEFELIEA